MVVGLLVGDLVGGEFVRWPEPDSFGGNRIPARIQRDLEESGCIRRNPVEIQEFLSHRNSCKKIQLKWLKTGIFKTPPNPCSCEQIPP
jgi:hypothetical protein